MAANKVKRSIPLAQPARRRSNPEPVELMPVKAHVYRAIAELNNGFEKVIQDLQAIGGINFLRSERLSAMHELICRVRAQANRDFIMALHDREMANVDYFARLCIQRASQTQERLDR